MADPYPYPTQAQFDDALVSLLPVLTGNVNVPVDVNAARICLDYALSKVFPLPASGKARVVSSRAFIGTQLSAYSNATDTIAKQRAMATIDWATLVAEILALLRTALGL
jgi:hypothetical protein